MEPDLHRSARNLSGGFFCISMLPQALESLKSFIGQYCFKNVAGLQLPACLTLNFMLHYSGICSPSFFYICAGIPKIYKRRKTIACHSYPRLVWFSPNRRISPEYKVTL
ncbi:hypothetical protein XENTR_v10024637 [Xenopus tropicalis]|nr:hypothetical protein XENTR_v10024637 [Xenopus tropicalis]